jgi:hypothetical protein
MEVKPQPIQEQTGETTPVLPKEAFKPSTNKPKEFFDSNECIKFYDHGSFTYPQKNFIFYHKFSNNIEYHEDTINKIIQKSLFNDPISTDEKNFILKSLKEYNNNKQYITEAINKYNQLATSNMGIREEIKDFNSKQNDIVNMYNYIIQFFQSETILYNGETILENFMKIKQYRGVDSIGGDNVALKSFKDFNENLKTSTIGFKKRLAKAQKVLGKDPELLVEIKDLLLELLAYSCLLTKNILDRYFFTLNKLSQLYNSDGVELKKITTNVKKTGDKNLDKKMKDLGL